MEIELDQKTEEQEHHTDHTSRSEATGSTENHKEHGEDHGNHHAHHEEMFRRRFLWSLVLTVPILLLSTTIQDWLGYDLPAFPGDRWVVPILAVILFVVGGLPFLRMAIDELRQKQPGMMTLISLAISVAFVYSLVGVFADFGRSFFWELATLIAVMLLGHWLEMRSVRRASSSLDELAKLLPDIAERIMENGETEKVSVSDLQVDDLVLVRPGESIPADGCIVEGESQVDESMITGESKPVSKEEGDEVIAGTTNDSGSLRIEVTAVGENTALSGIMRLVDEAQKSKSDTQVLADRAAGWLFYAALAAAILTTIAWTIATGFDNEVLKRTVTVLVIACPHALGLAVPLVVAITTATGANNGILIRDRIALEKARDADVIIFDKTGTLTEGQQGLADMIAAESVDDKRALALAAAVESDSEHVIARALVEAAQGRELELPNVSDFQALKGRGVQAEYDGQQIFVGSSRLREEQAHELPDAIRQFTDKAAEKGQSVVFLIEENKTTAAFALSDVIRPESATAVQELKDMGLEVGLLTGDSSHVAQAVADELGIQEVFAEVMPEDKDDKIQEIQDQGETVIMVGDGVNDAPALVRADVGVAIGGGTDVAIESAGLILVKNNPLDVVKMIDLSDASHRKMMQNIWWAAGYNIVAIPLAAGVLAPIGFVLPPAVGALIMSVSTVIVAINAQLLRRWSFEATD